MSQLPRFFLAAGELPAEPAAGLELALAGPIGHQIGRVLRLRSGDRVVILDGRGGAWEAVLAGVAGPTALARIAGPGTCAAEPPIAVTLFAAVLKGERQDWLVQKAVELGVARIQPILCARSVARPGADKVERWARIAREAAEQSERGIVPPVAEPIPLETARWGGDAIVCTERDGRPLAEVVQQPRAVAIFIGPEGGWEPGEISLLLGRGAKPASLGPRILRAETAALAALAILVSLP